MTGQPPRSGGGSSPDAGGAGTAVAFPPWKAFILQFRDMPAGSQGTFSGRLEHLHSGRRVEFASREDLLAALEQLLDKVERRGGG